MEPIRILIADDHAVVREGTRQILDREADMCVVAQASDGKEAIDLAVQERPRVAVLDISMPNINGIEATRRIKELLPATAVLVFTAYDYDEYVFAILEAGAAGYLLKNSRGSELIEAVRRVASGESVLHPAIAAKVLNRVSKREAPAEETPIEALTERELEVLRLAALGHSNREIADQLYVSPRTVQSHMANIFGKLNVGSRTEAVMVGLKRGWIHLGELTED
ncbi:MAG: response regulator transcription factor [Chloroflexi bacterium]|jgi:NarL family two-component system response regulator LiaR|nr:response regulator transcription factor [Chloroflexota bacterium]